MSGDKIRLLGVDIIIYDSSDDSKTEQVVKNYQLDGLPNVKYARWKGIFDGFSLDSKVIDAYLDFCDEYEYLWPHRDGLILNSESIKKKILPALYRNNDFIIINTTCRDYKKIGSKVYSSAEQLFIEQMMQMTVLGATITKSTVVKEIIRKVPNEKGKTYGLWQPMSIFHYIADKKFRAESIVDDIWIYNILAAKASFWGKNTLKQWCDMWCDMINNLPTVYDAYKQNAMRIYMTDFQPFYAKNLLSIRANGGLSFSEINKCKDKLKYVCSTPVKVFYIIACVPSSVAKFLLKHNESIVYKIIKYIYFIIFGIVPGEKEIIE